MAPNRGTDSPLVIMAHLSPDVGRAFARRVGMSMSRTQVLHELFHTEEMSQMELQQRLDMEGSLLTRFVKQMEAEGLVTRRPDPKDNRYTLVALAPPGRKFLEEMEQVGVDFEEQLLDGLTEEEIGIFVKALKQMQHNLTGLSS
jgi:DNA-binding MarR family transcriptional regulator